MDDCKHSGDYRMSFTYRENQNSPLTWAQLDGNFREVEVVQKDVSVQAMAAAASAESASNARDAAEGFSEHAEEMARISTVRWCGNHTEAPTTRLDGSPLEISDEYGNLTDHLRYNWTGTSWVALNSSAQDLEVRLSGNDGAEMIGLLSPLDQAVPEDVGEWINRQESDLERFGGRGDYVTDNSLALEKLLASGVTTLKLNRGMYRFGKTEGFPSYLSIRGEAAPDLGHGTFDDKQWLRTGYKHLMPGSSMIFSGSGTEYPCPQRIGEFANLKPCVRIYQGGQGSVGTTWSDFAIIQDMECRTEDGTRFTKPWEDNHADYDTALMIDDVARMRFQNVVRFGYFGKIGTAISSVLGNDDPDYNQFIGGSTMGRIGIALLGSNNGPAPHGLSGTHTFGHAEYSLDHHSRGEMTTDELTAYYADADTWRCIYIDGDVDAGSAEINGHEFHASSIRTNANHAIEIDHASNVKFFGGVYEFRAYGVPNSTTPSFIGSTNVKRGVAFYDMRDNFLQAIFSPSFIGTIPVKVIVTGDPLNGRLGVFGRNPNDVYSGVVLGSDGNIGDCSVQLTTDANNGSSDWLMAMDVSDPTKPLQFKKNGVVKVGLSESGAINLLAPTGLDATILLTSNAGSSVWAVRPQTSSAGQLQFRHGGSGSPVLLSLSTGGNLSPGATAAQDLGAPGMVWDNAYLQNAPIVSSDEEMKKFIEDIPESWLSASRKIKRRRYKMKSRVAEKGEAARWHIGVIAQDVVAAFASEGVDAFEIGIVGFDEWGDIFEDEMREVLDADGTPTGELLPTGAKLLVRAAGTSMNVRYDELLMLFDAARL